MSNKKYILIILMGISLFTTVFLTYDTYLSNMDKIIIDNVQGLESASLTRIISKVTDISDTMQSAIITAVIAIVLFVKKYKREAVYLAITMITCAIAVTVIKNIVKRPRPNVHRLIDISGYSFPSGHTLAATMLYLSLALILIRITKTNLKKLSLFIASIGVIFIAFTRIYLGVHYPTDTLAGMSLGITLVSIYHWLFFKSKFLGGEKI